MFRLLIWKISQMLAMSHQEGRSQVLDDGNADSGRGVSAGLGNHTQFHCPSGIVKLLERLPWRINQILAISEGTFRLCSMAEILTAVLEVLLDSEITHNFNVLPATLIRLAC